MDEEPLLSREDVSSQFKSYLSRTNGFQFGAVAFFDALGFKGIWERHPPSSVLNRLSEISDHARELEMAYRSAQQPESPSRLVVRIGCLSDTIVVLATTESPDWETSEPLPTRTEDEKFAAEIAHFLKWGWAANASVKACAQLVSLMTGDAASKVPCLSYRGAVSVGEFAVASDHTFFIGPAVDECAEFHQKANGAMVFATPSTMRFLRLVANCSEWFRSLVEKANLPSTSIIEATFINEIVKYVVLGYDRQTFVVNPLYHLSEPDWLSICDAVLESFVGDEKVLEKKENTRIFFEKCREMPTKQQIERSLSTMYAIESLRRAEYPAEGGWAG